MRSALSFLTVVGRGRPPGPTTFDWFPVVGAGLGGALGGLWWLAGRVWPAPVAAAVVVAGDLALTGLLHFDGLVDSADGLLPHLPVARRLDVMASPEIGAFGVGVAGVVLLLRWAALDSIRPAVLVLAALWCLSRTLMVVVVRVVPYARPGGGLASAFAAGSSGGGRTGWVAPVVGLAGAIALALAWKPLAGAVALAAAGLAAAAVVALARRRIGGYTGDVLGAAGVVAETVGLVVAAVRW